MSAKKKTASKPKLLSGGNPQVSKANGDAPVREYIEAMPGWKSVTGSSHEGDAADVTAYDRMRGAQAALLFVELRKHEVSAELHVYAKGGHGYGIRPSSLPVSTWHHRLADWLKRLE